MGSAHVSPHQAEAIIAGAQADFVALARGFLDDPRWGWHAAAALGADAAYPPQYRRARPEPCPGNKAATGRLEHSEDLGAVLGSERSSSPCPNLQRRSRLSPSF